MKTAISIPDSVFEAAERTAKRLSISRSELYTTALKEFIEIHGLEGITEQLNEVYAEESSQLDPVLAQMQSASLAEEEW